MSKLLKFNLSIFFTYFWGARYIFFYFVELPLFFFSPPEGQELLPEEVKLTMEAGNINEYYNLFLPEPESAFLKFSLWFCMLVLLSKDFVSPVFMAGAPKKWALSIELCLGLDGFRFLIVFTSHELLLFFVFLLLPITWGF